MGCRSEELDAHTLAFFGDVAEKNDTAFLLFLGERVGEGKHSVHLKRLIQAKHTAMRVDHNRFTGLAKTAAVGVFPRDHNAHAHKYSGTASNLVEICLWHDNFMLRHIYFAVNDSVNEVFPLSNLGAWMAGTPRTAVFPCAWAGLRAMIPQVIQ